MDIPSILQRLAEGNDLSVDQTSDLILSIMSGELDQAQTAAIFMGLRCKGETADEIVGAARAMREKAVRISSRHTVIADTCGTGGDRSGTFNISTVTAFVVSAAGVVVAKHCNRSASSKCGSADLFEALGLRLDAPVDQVTRCLDETGFTVLFARSMHPAMKHVAPVRSSMGIRTIFNFLGPLTNPAGATHQLIGISEGKYRRLYAEVLAELGAEGAMVVHGRDGLDEVSLTGETDAIRWKDGDFSELTIVPEDAGLKRCVKKDLLGGDKNANAAIAEAILRNEDKGPKQDATLLNTGAVLWTVGTARDLREGVERARETLESGRAWEKLQEVRKILG